MRSALLCPFSAGTVLWQGQDGAWTLTACVRGTFSLVHGREAVLADLQEPVGGDMHLGGDPRASLYAPSEIVPYKVRADVILVGSAFAPDQRPVEALVARLAFGELDKSIGVVGDRVWIEGPDGLEPSEPAPFRSMPLDHERAARAPENPVGVDLTRPPVAGALALPNLEAVDDAPGGDRSIGFGSILVAAPSRRGLLHPDAWAWAEGGRLSRIDASGPAPGARFAHGPVPPGFDFSFYNAAPRDQQIELIRSGASIVLDNLNREHAHLETRLPSVKPKVFLVSPDLERGVEIALRCDTLWIDAERGIFSLTWRGLAVVDTPDEDALGTLVVAAESKGREIRFKHIERILREGTSVSLDEDSLSETHALGLRHDAVKARDLLSQPTIHDPPRVFERSSVESNSAVSGIWDELSESDLVDAAATETEEPTFSRPAIRVATDDTFTEPMDVRRFAALHDAAIAYEARAAGARAPLAIADYARLAVAIERGEAAPALAEYGYGLADLPEIQRSWSIRLAGDAALASAFNAAVEAARRNR